MLVKVDQAHLIGSFFTLSLSNGSLGPFVPATDVDGDILAGENIPSDWCRSAEDNGELGSEFRFSRPPNPAFITPDSLRWVDPRDNRLPTSARHLKLPFPFPSYPAATQSSWPQ